MPFVGENKKTQIAARLGSCGTMSDCLWAEEPQLEGGLGPPGPMATTLIMNFEEGRMAKANKLSVDSR